VPVLLCDLDDTLLDRAATFRIWAEKFTAQQGLDPICVDHLIEEDQGGYRDRTEFTAAVSARLGLTTALTPDVYLDSFLPHFVCAADVSSALTRARSRGWKIAVVTNGGAVSQAAKIEVASLGALVDAVCISDVEGCRKPDPRLLEIAAARVGQTLEGAWMIGDNAANDIGAAVAAGISSVWLKQDGDWPLSEYRPTAEADSFSAAVDLAIGR
jgi:putative hydrolase of the HAD superfamily